MGLSRDELCCMFALGLQSSIRDVKILRERAVRTSLGEFPSDEAAMEKAVAELRSVAPEDFLPVLVISLLKVVNANNEQIARQLEPYLAKKPAP
ncbi:MAG: hypothetical protein HYX87_01545 [Chloroflexi bacterium]|nr:hypothetical protein [Chloroflexota bacterium]